MVEGTPKLLGEELARAEVSSAGTRRMEGHSNLGAVVYVDAVQSAIRG
ncbi:hypothetical protein ACTG9Q_32790 [Actinokineospora sp. 24-640]